MKSKVTILSYNIHKGFSPAGTRKMLQEMRVLLREVGADIVFLQEVMGVKDFRSEQSQFEYLADQIWPHYAYGKNY